MKPITHLIMIYSAKQWRYQKNWDNTISWAQTRWGKIPPVNVPALAKILDVMFFFWYELFQWDREFPDMGWNIKDYEHRRFPYGGQRHSYVLENLKEWDICLTYLPDALCLQRFYETVVLPFGCLYNNHG